MGIIDKAKKLGLDIGDGTESLDNLRAIASQVGFSDFESLDDASKLDSILSEQLSSDSSDNIENLDNDALENNPVRNEKFGQREYDQAKKDGVYNKEHYKNKQSELDKKAEDLNEERHKDWKMKKGETGPVKSDGSNTVRKSKMDRVMDNLNYVKAKKGAIDNKIAGAKANAYNAMHPLEAAKDKAKSEAKNAAKDVGKQAAKKTGEVAKEAGKQAGKVVAKLGAKLVAFIAANPWILLIIGGVALFFIIIVAIMGGDDETGYYSQECNFNATTVTVSYCNTEDTTTLSLKNYVISATYALLGDGEYSEEQIKAAMIVVKTNALSNGYNNNTKNVSVSTCDMENFTSLDSSDTEYEAYEESYSAIENYLYLSSSFNSSIVSIDSSSYLNLDLETLANIDGNYQTILSTLYNGENTEETYYIDNLFVGDSRVQDLSSYGIINSSKVIYGSGYGYDWLIGNGSFSNSNTNAINGGISGVNSKIKANTKYNIVIWLGVNDLDYITANDYYNAYYELASGDWFEHNLYIVEVGPVQEDSNISNEDIDSFNSTMNSLISSSGLNNLRYIDINYNISEFDDVGLHYSSSDYSKIYNEITNSFRGNTELSGTYKLYDLDDYCEYIVIDKSGESNVCESMSISSTSLSKSEFVSKLESYYGSASESYKLDFKNNAEDLYDIAVSNGINPELVVVRASLEGYSPASKGYSSYYNYWGIRCYNNQPLSTCASYSSFSDGVLGFVKNVSQYDSLSSMMRKYAYIGDYWYNPGNAGSGGCYYFPYIKKYMSSTRISEVESACSSSNTCSGSSCLKTNNDDQLAYSLWQVEKMASQRNTIFNISSDYCDGYSQNCTLYAQGDSRWKNIKLGNSNSTMGSSGCAVTSLAIGISCSGTEISVANFDAGKFLEKLNAGNCFTNEGAIYWSCSAISEVAPNVSLLSNTSSIGSQSNEYKINLINENNVNNNIVLVHFVNSSHPRGHYVAVTYVNGNNVVAKDPSGGKVSTINVADIDQVVVYST